MHRVGDHSGWFVSLWGCIVSVQACVNAVVAGLTISVLVLQIIYSVNRNRKIKIECQECKERASKGKL